MVTDLSSEMAVNTIQFVEYCDQRCILIIRIALLDLMGVVKQLVCKAYDAIDCPTLTKVGLWKPFEKAKAYVAERHQRIEICL
jgi:hypothetical protein